MARRIFIFCDGGLGNRLGALTGGLVTAELLDCEPVISWPQNNWCGCKFSDLFVPDICNNTDNIFQIVEKNMQNIFILHENQTNMILQHQFEHSLANIDLVKTLEQDIVYYHNKIAPFLTREQVVHRMEKLKIKKNIYDKVNVFVQANNIDDSVTGLHLRKTDMIGLNEEKFYKTVLANPQQRYFVCSDDFETEKKFAQFPNVMIYPKRYYAKKLKKGDWRSSVQDTDGRPSKYNVARGSRSVQQAFVDLLILSRTNIQFTIKSSFSLFAGIYAEMPSLPH